MGIENELIGVLDNGMSYYLYNKKGYNIKFILAINAGANSENEEENGIAHLLEHMCMSYSKFKDNHIFVNKFKRIESDKYKFSADTDFDRIILRILSKEHNNTSIENGVFLLEKIINGKMIKEDLLEEIKKEVIKEIIHFKKRNEIQSEIIDFITNGNRKTLPMGTIKYIKNLSINDILEFHKRIFIPSNIGIIIIGDIDVKKAKNILNETFNLRSIKKNAPIETKKEIVNNYLKNEILTINKRSEKHTVVKIYYKCLYKQTNIKERMVKYFFESMFESRVKKIFKSYGLNINDITNVDKKNIDGDYYFVFIYKTKYLSNTVDMYLRIIDDIKLKGFTRQEYKKKVKELMGIMKFIIFQKIDIDIEDRCKAYIDNFIYNDIIFSIQEDYDLIIKIIQDIGIDEINKYMRSILKNKCKIVVLKRNDNNLNFFNN